MKNKTKKIGLAALSLSMAAVLSASVSLQTPVQNMQNGGFGGNNNIVSADSANMIKMSDEFTANLDNTQFFKENQFDNLQYLNSNSDGTRRIIVEFESKSQLDLYLENRNLQTAYADFSAYVNADAGKAYAQMLEKEHDDFFKAINQTSLNYEYRHAYTSILNGVSLVVDSKDVSRISKMSGVKNIILSEVYAQPLVEPTINVVDVYGTGIYDSSDLDYKGDGMLVAVLDTGFDVAHPAFQHMPDNQKRTLADIEGKFSQTAASVMGASDGTTAKDVYYNEKVPFAYDYADKDSDVFAIASSHGVHVAGIIAGKDDTVTEEDDKAFKDGTKFVGVAPNAQLMIGKVFSDVDTARGAETDDILAAVADCVVIGADVINMSLGMSCGFTREEDGDRTNEIYDSVYAAGINLVVAASNDASSGQGGAYGSTNLTTNPDSATVGSPASYVSALSVASISGQKASYMQLNDGTAVYFNESSSASGQQGKFVEELLNGKKSRTLNFVVVPGFGRASNYNSEVKAELAKGNCVAVVSRGDTSFEEKQKVAFDNGAVACIIYNNMSGKISASLGTGKKIPTCTVVASIGRKFTELGKGTIYLDETFKAGPFMSDFSSWGPAPDLRIKPEITAHGGEITSAVVGGYKQNSGTSMAAPNMAGAVALLRQHVAENQGLSGIALATRVNQLLMSTATIVNDENGLPYAVRKQGAGLGDIGKAINTEAYLYVENSTKSKIELGDDPDRTGVYTMHFRAENISNVEKTYKLGAIVMTESVSIDNITVEEKAHLLNNAQKSFFIDGRPVGDTVTLAPGADVEITMTLALSADEKAYMEANFKNGMYIEGFVTLTDVNTNGVDLSIPYLAFYGDWKDAPIFDASAYEVSKDKYDASIKEEDKTIAAVFESSTLGKVYKEYSEFYLPLGQYIYNMPNDADSGVEASVDKIAIGNSEYGVYEFYAMYLGMLRAAGEMDIRVENATTGEVVYEKTEYNVRKSHNAGPSVVEMEINPIEYSMMNNERYKIVLTARPAYESDSVVEETREFAFFIDYQAPMISNSVIRYEDNGDGTRKAFLDLEIYDNHYPQSIQLFVPTSETDADFLTVYPIPIVNSVYDGISKISINVTDYMQNFANAPGEYKDKIGVRVDDYALNASAYLISTNKTIVDEVKFEYSYKNENKQDVVESLSGQTVVLRPNQAIDLTKDTATIVKGDGTIEGKMSASMVGYASFYCTKKDAHGAECGFVFDEIKGYSYKKGDYYYDAASGKVLTKEADDEQATYGPYTRYFDVIATPVERDGNRYKQPTSKNFVCPACGAAESFGFNSRTGALSTKTFKCTVQDPMIFDVEFISSNPEIVQVRNGMIYAVASEGTATITARPWNWMDDSNDFVFNVTINQESKPVSTFIKEITVGSVYNHTKNVTRYASNGGITVDCGTELTLYPSFKPWYVTKISDLTWMTTDPEMVEIVSATSESARVICKKTGGASILLSSPSSGVIGTFTIVINEEYTMTSYFLREYNGTGYSETYVDEKTGETRKMLVIPANLGIVYMGTMSYSGMTYDGTFQDVKGLDTVVIPQGVTTIGSACFKGTSIRRLFLPSSIEVISSNAFYGTPIEEVYWYDADKDSNSKIEYDADDNTYNWDAFKNEVTQKSTAKNVIIHPNAFGACRSLKVFDSSRVSAMYGSAFSSCSSLEYADLSNVRFAQGYVYSGCTKLSEIIVNADTAYGANMFSNTALTEIDFYGTIIPSKAFAGMKNVEKIVIHNDVKFIGSEAFSGCTKLSNIEFKGTCKEIGTSAFNGCTSLTEIILPAGLETIGNTVFAGCSNLETVSLRADSNVQSIGLNMFKGCNALKSVKIAGVTSTDNYNTVTATANGVTYSMVTNANGTKIIMMPAAYPIANSSIFTVPAQAGDAEITDIAKYSYAYNASLSGKEVVIPEGITSIGEGAFRDTGITKVTIPASVTEIGAAAFAGCTNLETVVFLCDLQEIPAYAFDGCKKLTNVQIPSTVETIGEYSFRGTDVRTLTISENVRVIGLEAFRDAAALVELNFSAQSVLEVIGQAAFAGCVSLKSVEMPDTVTELKNSAFVGCSSLQYVYVSAGLEMMEGYVFSACPMLTTFVMGDGAKMLGDHAFFTPAGNNGFYYHQSLANVTIPDSVESIGAYAFAGNTALEELIANGVKTIGEAAFHYATALETMEVNAVESIGANAFVGSGIKYFNYGGNNLKNVKYFGAQAFLGTELFIPNSGTLYLNAAVEIDAGAFYNCKTINKLVLENVVTLGYMAFGGDTAGKISSVQLGTKLEKMGSTVFYNQPIESISLPATLAEIEYPAFVGCGALRTISVSADNKTFFVENGGLYKNLDNGTYELVAVPNNLQIRGVDFTKIDEDYKNLQPFQIKEGTSRIGSWAMGYCVWIHAVEIPASVKSIGPYAFFNVGYAVLENNQKLAQTSRAPYTKFIFKGLQAPVMEADYVENLASLSDLYATFVYKLGYLLSDMIIPVNAKGFESLMYRMFFMEVEYSEELMEEDTQKLLSWLEGVDVDALTLADKAIVDEMNMIYFMMSATQKAFINEELAAKLVAAVDKLAAMQA